MGTKNTDWENLGIENDFLFGKIMQDPELCKELLQRIFPDLKIEYIEYPELQKGGKMYTDTKNIRLVVYVQDDKNIIYAVEMQTANTQELPKRARFSQAMLDFQALDEVDKSYKKLNKSYIIFICTFDLYKQGRHIYTFENICKEDHKISMGDETTEIFLNPDSEMEDVSKELKVFLDYVKGIKTEDSFIKKLETAVEKAKKNREWRHEYMTLLMREAIIREDTKEQTRKEDMKIFVEGLRAFAIPDEAIIGQLIQRYQLNKDEASRLIEER